MHVQRDEVTRAPLEGPGSGRVHDIPRPEIALTRLQLTELLLEDLGMKYLLPTAAEDLLEVFVCRNEKDAIILTSNRPMEG